MVEFTDEQIAMIAEAERRMAAGEVPFVVCGGQRLMVQEETMRDFGLTVGQEVPISILGDIIGRNMSYLSAQVAMEKSASPEHDGQGLEGVRG